MTKDIREYIEKFDKCHQIKPVKHGPNGKLNSLNAPRGLFTDLIIDFITVIPLFGYHQVVYDSIFFIIDRYIKMARNFAVCMD